MSDEVHEKNGIIVLRGDASKFKPMPLEGKALQEMNDYLERMKLANPNKYAAIMRDRERLNKGQKPKDNGSEQVRCHHEGS